MRVKVRKIKAKLEEQRLKEEEEARLEALRLEMATK